MVISTMMTTKVLKKLVLGVAVGAVSLVAMKANPANAASFNFSLNTVFGLDGTGSVAGFDNDLNGLLTKTELTSFNFESRFGKVDLNSLSGFGSFNLNTAVWNADGAGWNEPTGSYFSWDNGGRAIRPPAFTIVVNDYVPTPPAATVPEPASALALLAFGAMGADSMLKRKQQQKATVKA